MSKPTGSVADVGLGPAGEEQWARLRRQLELAEGFWLGFVFTSSPARLRVLMERTENVLRARARTQVALSPATPEALVSEATRIVELQGTPMLGCVWLAGIAVDEPGRVNGPWERGWDRALLTLNQARQPLRKQLGAGLIVAAPQRVKPRIREAAPDIWSIRSLVIDLDEVVDDGGVATKRDRQVEQASPLPTSTGPPDPTPAVAEDEETDEARELVRLLRSAERKLAAGDPADAVELAARAVDLAARHGDRRLAARATTLLGEAAWADGDVGAATDHAERAVERWRGLDDAMLVRALARAGELAGARGDLERAASAGGEQLAVSRRLSERDGDDPQALRDLSVSLDNVGDVQRDRGDLDAAAAAYDEALSIARRLLDSYGDSPQALRDLSISLDNVGDVQRARGDLDAAATAYDEALTLAAACSTATATAPRPCATSASASTRPATCTANAATSTPPQPRTTKRSPSPGACSTPTATAPKPSATSASASARSQGCSASAETRTVPRGSTPSATPSPAEPRPPGVPDRSPVFDAPARHTRRRQVRVSFL